MATIVIVECSLLNYHMTCLNSQEFLGFMEIANYKDLCLNYMRNNQG